MGRLRKKNESLNRKIDQIKSCAEIDSLQTSPLHTGTFSIVTVSHPGLKFKGGQ